MKSTLALPLLASVLVLACQEGPATAPDHAMPPVVAPRFDFMSGPRDLPNVFRWERENYAVSIQDPETDLIAWAGLPDDATMSAVCKLGGDETFAAVDVQRVGEFQDVIHRIMLAPTINLHVYTLSTFPWTRGFCSATPIARGVGQLVNTDNDAAAGAFPGADAWGWRMEGPVTLAAGGDALLLAHNRWLLSPDGALRLIFRQVKLLGP
jgi:hypothetical protein